MNMPYNKLRHPVAITDQEWPEGVKPLVSVCCITYNHENFIQDCLNGILRQETSFPVEILIHDDASTDQTANIIREYEEKYPNLIRAIYQNDNQYSKGIKPSTIVYPAARGEYIAICEGDDYWISDRKLQTQFDTLRGHPDSSICFHPAIRVRAGTQSREMCCYGNVTQVIPVEMVIRGGGGFMPTSSILIRARALNRVLKFFAEAPYAPVGDIPIQVIGSAPGGALFLPIVACTYRFKAPGSWTERIERDETLLNTWFVNKFLMYAALDRFLNYEYCVEVAARMQMSLRKELFLDQRIALKSKRQVVRKFGKYLPISQRLLWSVLVFSRPSYRLARLVLKVADVYAPHYGVFWVKRRWSQLKIWFGLGV
jgi:glycosyltransferase involved in cell wall biosynthesis